MSFGGSHSRQPLTVQQFWARFDKSGPCWIWRGNIDSSGRGYVSWRGRKVRVHRLAWELTFGPATKFVCHRCDTPACGNPEHLFEGTHADNMADMKAKGRQQRTNGWKQGFDPRRRVGPTGKYYGGGRPRKQA